MVLKNYHVVMILMTNGRKQGVVVERSGILTYIGMPVIMRRACHNDWLAQLNLSIVHKGGLKEH
jgi:hypothetical protein